MISLIWAMDESNLIGANNKMPWHVKEDLIYFKNITKNHIVVMGYNTYLSMLGYYKDKPFPYKKTYVLTHKDLTDDRVCVVHDKESILKLEDDIFIVGGKSLYMLFINDAKYLYISYIKGVHTGDTYIDFLDLNDFDLIKENITEQVRYTVYERKKN